MDIQQARQLCKMAAPEDSRKQKAKDYIPQNMAGAVGDYLTPGSFGGHRAGKATALAKGLGKEPGLTTTNPLSSSLLGMLTGTIGGGMGGAALGNLLGSGEEAGPVGGLLGALGGGLAGGAIPTYMRRKETKQNLKEYGEGAKIKPEAPAKLRGLGNLLLPLSGAHRKGEAVGYNKLRGIDEDQTMDHAINAGRTIGGTPLSIIGGALQNYSADSTMNKRK